MITVLDPVPTNECDVSGPCVLVFEAPESGSPKFHEYDLIVAVPNTCVFRALSSTGVPTAADVGDAEHVGIGLPLDTDTDRDATDVRPALSVTTRLTANVPVDRKTCVVMPLLVSHAGSPGQWTIGVESPKFQSSATILLPCASVVVRQSNTTVSPMAGVLGENVKFAVGAGALPIVTAVPAEV